MPFDRTVTLLLIYETCGVMAAHRALCGAATAMNGQEVTMLLLWNITRTTSEISLLKSFGRIKVQLIVNRTHLTV